MFTALLTVIAVITAYTFITGLVSTVLKCWVNAKPQQPVLEVTPAVETIADPWNEDYTPASVITTTPIVIEYRTLVLAPATKKTLRKPISKMLKAELQTELQTWGKSTDGIVKQLRDRLETCYK